MGNEVISFAVTLQRDCSLLPFSVHIIVLANVFEASGTAIAVHGIVTSHAPFKIMGRPNTSDDGGPWGGKSSRHEAIMEKTGLGGTLCHVGFYEDIRL